MANTLGDMVISIVGDTAGFNKSLTDTQKKMVAFGVNAVAIGAAALALGKAIANETKKFTDYGSAIFDASQKTGLSTDAIQEWKFIAEQTGTTLETITSSVALMTKGLNTNADQFKNLGIETKNADGSFRSTTDIFNDTITALSSMGNETERDQVAFKLLGRGAQDMIPILNAGGTELERMRVEARDLGIVLNNDVISNADQLGDSLDALKTASETYSASLVNTFAPALIVLTTGLSDYIKMLNRAATATEDINAASAGKAQLEQYANALKQIDNEIFAIQGSEMSVADQLKYITELNAKRSLILQNQFNQERTNIELAKKAAKNRADSEIAEQERVEAERQRIQKQAADDLAKAKADELKTAEEKAQAIIDANQAEYDATYELTQSILEFRKQAYLDDIKANEENGKTKLEVEEKANAESIALLKKYSDTALEAYSAIGYLIAKLQNNAIQIQIEGQTEELRLLKEKLDAGIISEESYAEQKLQIEKEGRQEAYKLELAAFNTSQAFAIAKALIDTAGAVVKSLTYDPTGILAIITGLLGAAQVGLIVAQKPPSPPTFADGGIVQPQRGGVQALVAEAGKAEAIIPLDRLDSMLTRSGGIGGDGSMMNLVVNLDSRPLLDKIFEATRNQTVLISAGAIV